MNILLELPQSLFNPNGTASHTIFNLTSIVFLTFSVVGVVMWILIGWAALRRRGSFDWHAPVGSNDGRSWIYIGGLLVPGIVLTVVFILGLRSLSAFPIHADHHPAADIRLVGHQWWWDVQYLGAPDRQVRTANEIHIPVGRDVMLELVSADVIHSFWVPSLHGKMDLIPGEANYLSLHAENAGTYRGQCAELCGVQHANMILLVVAESQQDYEKWLGHQREQASAESASAAAEGRNVFLSKPCALCHTIRGTPARAGVAPDLTHFASRQRLASNMLSNDEANLAAWITHAQSLKPGAAMPDVTQFSGEELQAIVAYLRLLK